ncbi:unknown [Prevotella sp. CAG:873]|nr:unknown [Prevotella sp. CAG:873]
MFGIHLLGKHLWSVFPVRMYDEAWPLDTDFPVVICIAETSDEMRLEISAKDCL